MPRAKVPPAQQQQRWRELKRLQRARAKQDPTVLEKIRNRERERWHRRRIEGKVKVVADMGRKELVRVRKIRRLSNERYRQRKKANNNESLQPLKIKKINGRKKKNLNRSKVYRDLNRVTKENEKNRRAVWRLKKKVAAIKKKVNVSDSPKSRVDSLVNSENGKITETVKEKLLFGEVLTDQLKESTSTKSFKKKHVINQILSGKIIKKYRCLKYTKGFLSRTLSRKYRNQPEPETGFVKGVSQLSKNRFHEVVQFFLREDVTSVCPDKDAYVISYKQGKVKKRRRYLTGTLTELYERYRLTVPNPVSYTTFTRLKPFYCVMPKVQDRDTCLCKACENMKLLTETLHRNKILEEPSPKTVLASLCCPTKTEECMQRLCKECEDKRIIFKEYNLSQMVSYKQWEKIPIVTHDDTGKVIKKTYRWDKTEKTELAAVVVINYESNFMDYVKHMHRHYHQQNYFRSIKENLKQGDLYVHVDWSENYVKKKNREIQSAYYGASKEEVSFHTGMAYTADLKQGFCTISDCNKHSPANIITHLVPILKHFFDLQPGTSCLFLQSDSPSTQYRNKEMFYLVTQYLPVIFPNLTTIKYGYSESGHSKGVVDGIGGWCKNTVDSAVATGTDINNIDQIVEVLKLKSKKTMIMVIGPEAHHEVENIIPKNLKTFEGTMRVHSFTWMKENPKQLFLSSLSCEKCNAGESCVHFGMPNSPLTFHPNVEEQADEHLVDEPQHLVEAPTKTTTVQKGKVVVNDWIAVAIRNHWSPGIVEKVSTRALHVSVMIKHGKKKHQYVWPEVPDQRQLKRSDVLHILQKPPHPVGKYFKVEEAAVIDGLLKNKKL